MIEDRQSDYSVKGSLVGEKTSMDIDDAAKAHIMSMLTDLYSDPEQAVIREYGTNAIDSHVEAGNTGPIEVTLPTNLAPFLTIQDYGIGLSADDIKNIYSRYGTSTKRDTNEQTGMLGLGCKSALTYSNQFTLVGVKDGTEIQVSISREDDGTGSMTVVSETSTDAPNGVTVIIPAKRHSEIGKKAENFFAFWPKGTVLVNGQEPTQVEGLDVSDEFKIIEGYTSYIVMGHVAYPVELNHGFSHGHSLVAYVPIGAVHFTPSREALQMTPKTKARIEKIERDLKAAMTTAIQKHIDKAQSGPQALEVMYEWEKAYGEQGDYKWTGLTIPRKVEVPYKVAAPADPSNGYRAGVRVNWEDEILTAPRSSHVLSRHDRMHELSSLVWQGAIWIYDYNTSSKLTPQQRKRIDKWARDEGHSPTRYIFVSAKSVIPTGWVDKANMVDWATIKAVKLPSTWTGSNGATHITGSYQAYVSGHRTHVLADEIDTSKPLYHLRGGKWDGAYHAELLQSKGDCTVVILPDNRLAKFERDFPGSVKAIDAIKTYYSTWLKSITAEERKALSILDTYYLREDLTIMDAAQVKDPALKAAIKSAKVDLTKVEKQRKMFQNVTGDFKEYDWKNPLDEYPLYDRYKFRHYKADMYLYFNAAYAAKRKAGA